MDKLVQDIRNGENLRKSLSDLRAMMKTSKELVQAEKLLGDISVLTDLLSNEDPKVRKNAVLLLGNFGNPDTAESLYQAYQKEEKRFIRSAYLKALKQTDAYKYLSELKEQYETLLAYEPLEEERKHVREELHALEEIFRQEQEEVSHTFCGWQKKYLILLTTLPAYREVTAEQLSASKKGNHSLGVKAVVDNLRDVQKIRTYRELLFPLTMKERHTADETPEQIGISLAESNLLPLLVNSHKESAPFLFRLELRNGMTLEERSRYAKKIAAVIEEKTKRKLLNSTGDYEFEVRILQGKDGVLHSFLKMNTIEDERFMYRRNSVATSMHPSMASLLVELASPYLKKNAQILDPCCGVGTLLIERHKKLPAREIYGIDIYGDAIAGAKENSAAAGMFANYIHRDYFDFTHGYLFDEIISELPSRGKKTKEEQDRFYQQFFDKSKEHLTKDGHMFLYSDEESFVKKQLRLHPEFKLREQFLIRPKEGYTLYIISMRAKE